MYFTISVLLLAISFLISRFYSKPKLSESSPDYTHLIKAVLDGEPKSKSTFNCPDCPNPRTVLHDCLSSTLSYKDLKISPTHAAWLGDALHVYHIRTLLPLVNGQAQEQYTAGVAQTRALTQLRPSALPPANPNGTPPSIARISTVFETLYYEDLSFRREYANHFLVPAFGDFALELVSRSC